MSSRDVGPLRNVRVKGDLTIGGEGKLATESGATIELAGTQLTAEADEINQALDGIGATVTAANLDEVTDGSTTSLHEHELAEGANDVTATAAEVNQALAGIGITVTAANLDEVTDGSTTSLHEHELAEGANDVTATAAEVNQALAGIGVTVTAANLDDLTDGTTVTLHEHELAEGANDVTATAAEINQAIAGVGVTVTAANLDDLTDGTTVTLHEHELAEGANDVTATAAEINQAVAGVGVTVTAANLDEVTDGSTTTLHEHELTAGANDVTVTADQVNSLEYAPGVKASGILRVDANVADGETVTIGADVYEIDIINTDSGDDTAGGSWDNVTDPLIVDLVAYTNVDGVIGVGDLIRIENEIMKCTLIDGTNHTFARGRCGTTAAAHADANDIYISDTPGTVNIPVGLVVTLTPAAFIDALVAEINVETTEPVEAQDIDDDQVLLIASDVGVQTTALDEALLGANNEWDDTAMHDGVAAGAKKVVRVVHVPTAMEVTLGRVLIPLDFVPTGAIVQVRTTASGAIVAWDGAMLLRTAEQRVDLINLTSVDFAATDTIYVTAWE